MSNLLYPARLRPEEIQAFQVALLSVTFLHGDYLETGSLYGGSLALAGEALEHKRLHAIDPLDFDPHDSSGPYYGGVDRVGFEMPAGATAADLFWANVKHLGDRVQLHQAYSQQVIPNLAGPLCAVFLDSGDHSYDLVKSESALIDLLVPAGLFMVHNINLPGTRKALDEAVAKYDLRLVGMAGVLAIYRKPMRPEQKKWGSYIVPMTRMWEATKDLPRHLCLRAQDFPWFYQWAAKIAYSGPVPYVCLLNDARLNAELDLEYPIIVRPDGTILDGGHRLLVAYATGQACKYVVWGAAPAGDQILPYLLYMDKH